MSGSLEEAYVAVERAYGQGDFSGALTLAEALLPQVPAGRPDLLDQRLQLLLGHIHLYGLNQPAQAAAAYNAVLTGCSEPSYQALAGQGLELSRQQMPADAPPAQSAGAAEAATAPSVSAATTTPTASDAAATASAAAAEPLGSAQGGVAAMQPLPATPWLSQLQDPQLAMRQIQEACASAPMAAATVAATASANASAAAPVASGSAAASPWASTGSDSGISGEPAGLEPAPSAAAAVAPGAEAPAQAEPAGDERRETPPIAPTGPADHGDLVPASPPQAANHAEPGAGGPDGDDPTTIVPVVVTVEGQDEAPGPSDASEAMDGAAAPPEEPAAPAFSEEEWAELAKGLLLVDLSANRQAPAPGR